jgi:hypothetical protein
MPFPAVAPVPPAEQRAALRAGLAEYTAFDQDVHDFEL